ncbi:hypothetical protein [Hymenobacter sp. BT190]|uniref:hypothetical protein n=1 Tax=Hymenobacter sp. BT190 TaxID=2763505 RepID=UPI0016515378|nr:hypothetical protein [Hymenobacter sp. BT190]MBC6697120.1 hypothetical protein [Hymenobacter sp. BT190]
MHHLSTTAATIGAVLLAVSNLQAQSYMPGYIVPIVGDTVRGELENEFWEATPATLRFRPTAATEPQMLRTAVLQGFGFMQGRYWRRQYLTYDSLAETHTNLVQPGPLRTHLVSDSVMTEVLVDGVATLTAMRGATPHYFVQRPGRTALELVARTSIQTSPDGTNYVHSFNNYRQQLNIYFADCPALAASWRTLRFEPQQLQEAISRYNVQCQGQPNDLALGIPVKRPRLEWGILTGAAYTRTTLSDGRSQGFSDNSPIDALQVQVLRLESYYLNDVRLESALRPLGGLYADLLLAGRRWAIHTEATARTLAPLRYETTTGNPAFPTKTYELRGLQGAVALGVRVLRPLATGQLLAGLGGSVLLTKLSRNQAEYPGISSRMTGGLVLPVRGSLGYATRQAGGYLEAGYRQGRFTATASVRAHYGDVNDDTAVESVVADIRTGRSLDVLHPKYSLSSYQTSLTLAVRLNRNTDQR